MYLQVAAVIVLAAGTLPNGCGGALKTNVAMDDVCKDFATQEFAAADPALSGKETIERTLTVDVAKYAAQLESAQAKDVKLTLKSVTFSPLSGIEDFGFIDSAKIEIPASASKPAVSLLSYQKSTSAPKTIVLTGEQTDLSAYQDEETIDLNASLTGTPPTSAWKANVTACFKVSGSVDLSAAQK